MNAQQLRDELIERWPRCHSLFRSIKADCVPQYAQRGSPIDTLLINLVDLTKAPDPTPEIKRRCQEAMKGYLEIGVRFHGGGVAILDKESLKASNNVEVSVRLNTGIIKKMDWSAIKCPCMG